MATARSPISGNHSFTNTNGTPYGIQPENLDIAEIRYELNLRGIEVHGERRTLSARLRDCLVQEVRNGCRPLQPFKYTCTTNEELRYMRANFDNLRSRLEGVNRTVESQNNFMSLLLHISGRLTNLVTRVDGEEQQTVINYLKSLDDMMITFDQYKARPTPTAVISRNNLPTMPMASEVEQEQVRRAQHASRVENYLNNLGSGEMQQQQPDPNQQINSEPGAVAMTASDENLEKSTTDNANLLENRVEHSVRVNLAHIFDNTVQTASNVENLQIPINVNNAGNFNATPSHGGNARLSNVFQQSEREITHINQGNENELNFLRGFMRIEDDNETNGSPTTDHHGIQFNDAENQPLISLLGPDGDTDAPNRDRHEHNVNSNANRNRIGNLNANQIRNSSERRTFTINSHPTNYGAPQAQAYSFRMAPQAATNRFETAPMEARAPVAQANRNEQRSRENGFASNVNGENHVLERTLTQMSLMMQQMQVLQEQQQAFQRQVLAQTATNAPANVNHNENAQNIRNVNHEFPRQNNFSVNHSQNGSQFSNAEQRRHSLPVHKWPFKFSGDKKDYRLERKDLTAFFKKINIFSRSENISTEEVHQRVIHLLDGPALAWYSTYGDRFRTWDELKSGLKSHFETNLTKFQKSQMLGRRTQRSNESCMDYISAMSQLFEELDMTDESEKVAIIQNGLRDNYRWISHAQSWPTVAALDHQLRQIELSNDMRRFTPVQSQTFVSEVKDCNETELTNEKPLIDFNENEPTPLECMAIGQHKRDFYRKANDTSRVDEKTKTDMKEKKREELKQRMANWTCFNCREQGHGFTFCRKPIERVFCFKCGEDGVFAPDCSCQSKNA